MNFGQKFLNILYGLILLASGVIFFLIPYPYYIVALILSISLVVYGIRQLVYYFTMARHMVGGRLILYFGVIIFDAGIFVLSISDIPVYYIMIYLIILHAFSGVIDILRVLEARRFRSGSWKLTLTSGIINLLVAILCAVFIRSPEIAVIIFAAGLLYSGVIRIISAFRRTKLAFFEN